MPRLSKQTRDVSLQGKDEPELDIADAFRVPALRYRIPDAAGGAAEFRQHAVKGPGFRPTDSLAEPLVTPSECIGPCLRGEQRAIIPGPLPPGLPDPVISEAHLLM
jgi:hypothetical protein